MVDRGLLWLLLGTGVLVAIVVAIEAGRGRIEAVGGAGVTVGQHSNPQGDSLHSAEAPHTGEEE